MAESALHGPEAAEADEIDASDVGVLAELRRARRKRRVAEIHWVDALYQVYLTGIGILAVVLVSASFLDDGPVAASTLAQVRADGAAYIGVVAAAAVLIGLRSGSRGGPLALEAPDVRHVLMAPLDRGVVLRALAARQARFALLVGAGVGGGAGIFAAERLPGGNVVWVACGAAAGLVIVALAHGSALCASGARLPRWAATGIGGVLVAWSLAEVADLPVAIAPATAVGELALWPLDFAPLGIAALVVAGAVEAAGFALIGGLLLEAAERRTALVGELRFAVTLQDLRTALVLRRQLAAERSRPRPWLPRLFQGPATFPVWRRGWRGVGRWPVSRLLRLVLLAAVAGWALAGVWRGTTPLIVVAGLAFWVAGLDAVESLAQETDHPGRRDAVPRPEGQLMLAHLPVAAVVLVLVAAVTAGVAAFIDTSTVLAEVVLVATLPLALAGLAAAATSVLMGAPKPPGELSMMTPEIAGVKTVARGVWPPLLATAGTVPVLIARVAVDSNGAGPPSAAAGSVVTLAIVVLVFAWVRLRADISAWWAEAQENAGLTGTSSSADDDDDDEEDDDR